MSSAFFTRYNECKTTKQAMIQFSKLLEQAVEICHIMTQFCTVKTVLPDLNLIPHLDGVHRG